MVVGFNHNFRYKGEIYHVQTEDGGLKSPNIVTLLYKGGTILCSRKTSYSDIAKVDNLVQVVEELMKEQHKEMLRKLKDGHFDEIIAGRASLRKAPIEPVGAHEKAAPAAAVPMAALVPSGSVRGPEGTVKTLPPEPVGIFGKAPSAAPLPPQEEKPPGGPGLDDIILSYLVGDDN